MATIVGTDRDDVRIGTLLGDRIELRGGNDAGDGREGADRIDGGAGDDELYGFHGQDVLFGGSGWDALFGENQRDTLYGGDGADWLDGGLGQDLLYGGAGFDEMFGSRGSDTLYGGDGNDELDGGGGPTDPLTDGNDLIYGGAGRDVLEGGLGFDVMYGGAGGDKFLYVGGITLSPDTGLFARFAFERDVAADFVKGQDKIQLLDFDAFNGFVREIRFGQLDSNRNGVLDDADRFVEVRKASIPGATELSTVIDVEAALRLDIEGTNTLTVLGVTGLKESDFV
jgi:Ca2+-binding RTX toxin-like protein